MVIFFTTLLGISIVGLIGLISVRRYEMSTGHVLFESIRPKVSTVLSRGLHFIEQALPALAHGWVLRAYRGSVQSAHRLTAWSVLHTERLLERTLHSIRHSTSPTGGGEASAFLREVAEHKEQLKKTTEERAIYEE